MKLIVRLLISAAVIFGVAYLSDGSLLYVDGFVTALLAALVLGLVNAVIKPIVKLFALPVTIFTLGLFSLVINAGMLYLVGWIVGGLEMVGFWQTMVAAVIISVVNAVLFKAIDND